MKRLRIALLWTLLVLGVLVGVGVIAVNARRNKIVKTIVQEVNGEIKGRVQFDDVHISGLQNFPEIELRVADIVLHQTSEPGARDTVAYVEYMYINLPVFSLWRKKFTIEDVYFTGGKMVLVDEWGGKLSIEKALALNKPFTERTSEDRGKNPLLLSIDSVHARDFQFIYRADRFKDELKLRIATLDAEFKQHGDSTIASARVVTHLEEQFNREDDELDRERIEGRIRVNADVVVTKNDLLITQIDLKASELLYHSDSVDLRIDSIGLAGPQLSYGLRTGPFFDRLSLEALLTINGLYMDPYVLKQTEFVLDIREGEYRFNSGSQPIFGKPGVGGLRIRPFSPVPEYAVDLKIHQFEMKDLMDNAFDSMPFFGTANMEIDLRTKGLNVDLMSNLQGRIVFEGDSLILANVDIDKFVRKFKRSQNFNLVDVGAVLVAGPIGLAASKGGAYANLALFSKGDTTFIRRLLSHVEVDSGRFEFTDVALSTHETRISGVGYVDTGQDTLEVQVDVINRAGCSLVGQEVYGTLAATERSKVKIVKTLLGPVENFLEDVGMIECKPVYTGSVLPPPTKMELRRKNRKERKAAKE